MLAESPKRSQLAAVGALFLVLGLVGVRAAEAAEVVLRVDGLACPFCAFGVEKKLLAVDAVAGMDIRINEGKVILRLHEGKRLDPVALNRAVEDAGFTLRKILVENAVGTLSQAGEGEFVLECSDPLVAFRIRREGEDALPGAAPAERPTRVEVTGELTEYVPEPTPLAITSLRPLGEEPGGPR